MMRWPCHISEVLWSSGARGAGTVREAQGLATAARKALPSSRAQAQWKEAPRKQERTVQNG